MSEAEGNESVPVDGVAMVEMGETGATASANNAVEIPNEVDPVDVPAETPEEAPAAP